MFWGRALTPPPLVRTPSVPLLSLIHISGLNAPKEYDEMVCGRLREMTGVAFTPDANKFHALTSKDALVFAHGALKALSLIHISFVLAMIRW